MDTLDTFDDWDFPKKMSFCSFLGTVYGGLNLENNNTQNSQTFQLKEILTHLGNTQTPFSQDDRVYDAIQSKPNKDQKKIFKEHTRAVKIMRFMPCVAIAARGYDPKTALAIITKICQSSDKDGKLLIFSYVYVTTLMQILNCVPWNIISDTIKEHTNRAEDKKEILKNWYKTFEISSLSHEAGQQFYQVTIKKDKNPIETAFMLVLAFLMCVNSGQDSVLMRVKNGWKTVEWNVEKLKNGFPKNFYEGMLKFTREFGDPEGFYASMLGAIIGACTVRPEDLEHHNSSLISLDMKMLLYQNTMLRFCTEEGLTKAFLKFYDNVLNVGIDIKNDDLLDVVDFQCFPDVDAMKKQIDGLTQDPCERIYGFIYAFNAICEETGYPIAMKFLCHDLLTENAIGKCLDENSIQYKKNYEKNYKKEATILHDFFFEDSFNLSEFIDSDQFKLLSLDMKGKIEDLFTKSPKPPLAFDTPMALLIYALQYKEQISKDSETKDLNEEKKQELKKLLHSRFSVPFEQRLYGDFFLPSVLFRQLMRLQTNGKLKTQDNPLPDKDKIPAYYLTKNNEFAGAKNKVEYLQTMQSARKTSEILLIQLLSYLVIHDPKTILDSQETALSSFKDIQLYCEGRADSGIRPFSALKNLKDLVAIHVDAFSETLNQDHSLQESEQTGVTGKPNVAEISALKKDSWSDQKFLHLVVQRSAEILWELHERYALLHRDASEIIILCKILGYHSSKINIPISSMIIKYNEMVDSALEIDCDARGDSLVLKLKDVICTFNPSDAINGGKMEPEAFQNLMQEWKLVFIRLREKKSHIDQHFVQRLFQEIQRAAKTDPLKSNDEIIRQFRNDFVFEMNKNFNRDAFFMRSNDPYFVLETKEVNLYVVGAVACGVILAGACLWVLLH